jgi:hypothetical protein
MSAHGFRSLFMAASVAGAALGCYLVSLNVASERAKLEAVEEKIVLTQRDIRLLQTEIGTRGRLAQLERWNAKVIRLSAPSADQFVEGGFQLAALVRPQPRPAISAPVVLAAAPAEQAVTRPAATSDGADATPPAIAKGKQPAELMHVASYTRPERKTDDTNSVAPRPEAKANATKPVAPRTVAAKPARTASADPLAPLLPTKPAGKVLSVTTKDSGTAR